MNEHMTVAELIEELKKYPQDLPVAVGAPYDCGYGFTYGFVDELEHRGITHYVTGKKYETDCVMIVGTDPDVV